MNTKPKLAACQNCHWVGPETEVDPDIPHYHERVGEDEPVPLGECPKCGALCHYVEDDN